MPDTSRTWDGGYIRRDARGRDVYVIRRTVGPRRYEVSTRATTSKGAHAQLALFEADPENYRPSALGDGIYLDADLSARFLAWSRAPRPNGAGNTHEWATQQRLYLAWWGERLEGLDLRRVDLARDILPALEGVGARAHRVAVLKRLYSWLRTVTHQIIPSEDPTFGTLQVPQSAPEQWRRVKAITPADFAKVRAAIVDTDYAFHGSSGSPYGPGKKGLSLWRDAFDVLAGTGWHFAELHRFAKRGEIDDQILVCPQTKGGRLLRTQVSPTTLDAAKRIRAHGSVTYARFRDALIRARKAAGIAAKVIVLPGIMRHSVATYAINAGATVADTANFLDHQDKRTTRRFYATHAAPAKVPTLGDVLGPRQ